MKRLTNHSRTRFALAYEFFFFSREKNKSQRKTCCSCLFISSAHSEFNPKAKLDFSKENSQESRRWKVSLVKKAFFHIPASFFCLCFFHALLELLHVANYGERNIPKTHDVRNERLFSLKKPSRRCNSIEFRLGSIKGERNNAK